jgi:hypothetical protein
VKRKLLNYRLCSGWYKYKYNLLTPGGQTVRATITI